ncbi:MAG: right-handed parallel beta-helix repeat-containing protein [Fidelibacterota bacterium]
MAEGFLFMNSKINGPLILGNSRWSHWTNSWELHREFSDLWSTGFVDSESDKSSFHAGVAEAVSKVNFSDHYLRYSHNCFGCPETEIWTDLLLSFNDVDISDNGSSITVNANVSGCNICACSGNKGSAFWWVENNVSSYTFNTSVRPLYITVIKHNYAPYTAVTGGTFTSDEYWFGNLHVLGDVTIASGATLSILDDTKVKVNAGYALTVHGTIVADGATFQSSGGDNWYGIDVDGSSSSYIKNCQIKDCDYDIIVGGSCAMSIKKNNIQAHYTGIRITEDRDPWIEDCYIRAKTIAPLITTGNGDGVVMRCNLGSTTPYNGPYYGHENMGSGSTCFNYYFWGRNKFEGNITYIGVYILGGYPTYAYGYNWIERPTYTTPYHVYNGSGSKKELGNEGSTVVSLRRRLF